MRGDPVTPENDDRLKYSVYVKHHGKWSLIAKCLAESDARLIANDRADGDQPAKVENGDRLVYQLG